MRSGRCVRRTSPLLKTLSTTVVVIRLLFLQQCWWYRELYYPGVTRQPLLWFLVPTKFLIFILEGTSHIPSTFLGNLMSNVPEHSTHIICDLSHFPYVRLIMLCFLENRQGSRHRTSLFTKGVEHTNPRCFLLFEEVVQTHLDLRVCLITRTPIFS